jgi:hypothetical protein
MAEHAEAAQEFNHRCSLGWKCQVEATWTSMYDQDTEVMTTPTSAASNKRKFRAVKESGTADTLGTSSSSSKKSKLNNNKQTYMRNRPIHRPVCTPSLPVNIGVANSPRQETSFVFRSVTNTNFGLVRSITTSTSSPGGCERCSRMRCPRNVA